jgi:hypothetical protein
MSQRFAESLVEKKSDEELLQDLRHLIGPHASEEKLVFHLSSSGGRRVHWALNAYLRNEFMQTVSGGNCIAGVEGSPMDYHPPEGWAQRTVTIVTSSIISACEGSCSTTLNLPASILTRYITSHLTTQTATHLLCDSVGWPRTWTIPISLVWTRLARAGMQ